MAWLLVGRLVHGRECMQMSMLTSPESIGTMSHIQLNGGKSIYVSSGLCLTCMYL